jgi:hypothetical protein
VSERSLVIEHNGKKLQGQIMTVESTSLTVEDHGIVSAWLHCKAPSTGIGVGGYCLDRPVKDEEGKFLRREGTAYGLDHIMEILKTAGVYSWEKLPGTSIVVLFEHEGSTLGRSAVGFAHLTDTDKVLIFKEHADVWREREGCSEKSLA